MKQRTLQMASILCALIHASTSLAANDPAKKMVLTVYTYESFTSKWGPGTEIKAAFESECACEINWVAAEDGAALLTKMKIEGKKTKADVVLGLDNNLVAEAADTGLFIENKVTIDTNRELPIPWDDPIFLPFDYGYFALMMDTEKIKVAPKSFREFVNSDSWNRSLIVQDPRTSTPGLGFLLWVHKVFGEESNDVLKKLRKKTLTVTKGWSEAYGFFTKGEAPFVLSYTTSEAYHRIEEKSDRYQAVPFTEGHYVQIEVAGLVKSSTQHELGRSFLKFLTDPRVQTALALKNWMLPVVSQKTLKDIPKAFSAIPTPTKALWFTPTEVKTHRKAWIQDWLTHFR